MDKTLVPYSLHLINELKFYVVENEKSARRFLKEAGMRIPQSELSIATLEKHAKNINYDEYLAPLLAGKNMGLISEAGCPAVADPGAEIVHKAHKMGIKIVPIVGPSSLMLALMASGFNGQGFTFHGYIPIQKNERLQKIKELENAAYRLNQTQLFIETPFRNNHLLQDILTVCKPTTPLCIACNITGEEEFIQTKTITEWKLNVPDLHKKPTVFLIYKD